MISLILLIVVTFMFYFLLSYKNPFVICMMVILSTFLLGMSMISMNISWFFYSIVVMFLGGMMVVFLYASSLSTLFKVETNFGMKWMPFILFIMSTSLMIMSTNHHNNKLPIFIYSVLNQYMIIYLIIFLLSVLFLVVKLSTSDTGPLKL